MESVKLYNLELDSREVNGVLSRMQSPRLGQRLQVSAVYLLYSEIDCGLIDRLQSCLDGKGIRSWHPEHTAAKPPAKHEI